MKNVYVVLVEPHGALNIGSICRVMMNFGFLNLRLVNPDIDYNGPDARKMALKAINILNTASCFENLLKAVEDCNLVFGTTCRFGKYRVRNTFLCPDQVSKYLFKESNKKIAYVFGREDVGLYNRELDFCNFFVTIPTNGLYASMNLSHAVSICLYEIRKFFLFGSSVYLTNEERNVATTKNLELMFAHMQRTLINVNYLDKNNPDHIMRSLRRIFGRTELNNREIQIIHGLFSRMDWTESERKRLVNDGNHI